MTGCYDKFRDEDDTTSTQQPMTEVDQLRAKAAEHKQFDNESYFAQFLVTWLSPLMDLATKTNLLPTDIPSGPINNKTPYSTKRFREHWQKHLEKTQEDQRIEQGNNITDVQNKHVKDYDEYCTRLQTDNHRKPGELPRGHKNNIPPKSNEEKKHMSTHPALQQQSSSRQYEDNIARKMKEVQPTPLSGILFMMFTHPVIISAIGEVLYYVFSLIQPYIVKLLSHYLNAEEDGGTGYGMLLALLMGFVSFMTAAFTLLRHHYGLYLASRVCGALLCAIFDKTLRIAPYSIAADSRLSAGSIANLVSQDVNPIYMTAIFAHFLWSGPIAILVCLFLMYFDLELYTTLCCAVLMILLIPFQIVMSGIQRKFKRATLKLTDQRIKQETQYMNGLKVVKSYGIEKVLRQKVLELRVKELTSHRKWQMTSWWADVVNTNYPLLVTFLSLTVYIQSNPTTFSTTTVFLILSYLNALKLPISFLANALSSVLEFHVSSQRIGHYLSKEELTQKQIVIEQMLKDIINNGNLNDDDNYYINIVRNNNNNNQTEKNNNHNNNKNTSNQLVESTTTTSPNNNNQVDNDILIKIKNCDFYWSSFTQRPHQMPVLANINLTIKRNEIIGIVASSGIGKTALLNSILGELYPQYHKEFQELYNMSNPTTTTTTNDDDMMIKNNNSNYLINGTYSYNNNIEIVPTDLISTTNNPRIAYCAQQPFLFSDTIRNNIILNNTFNIELYNNVIEASGLVPDLLVLKEGDYTICGDAVGLSGGQMARVSFARALYNASHPDNQIDIIILDDVFAAVDAYVAKTMFFNGVQGLLKGKTIIMTLNSHYDFLQHTTRILLLDTMYNDKEYYQRLHQYIIEQYNILDNNNNNNLNDKQKLQKQNITSSDEYYEYEIENYNGNKKKNNNGNNQDNDDINNNYNLNDHNNEEMDLFPSSPLSTLSAMSLQSVFQPKYINKKENADIEGFRQPSTIVFSGTFNDLMHFNHPLLHTFTFSTSEAQEKEIYNKRKEEEEDAKNKEDEENEKNGVEKKVNTKYGHIDEAKAASQAKKLQHQVESGEDPSKKGKSSSDKDKKNNKGPTQASLPSHLYLRFFQGSRGKFGLWFTLSLFIIFSLASVIVRTYSDYHIVRWANDFQSVTPQPLSYWTTSTGWLLISGFILFILQVGVFIYIAIDASTYFHMFIIDKIFHSTTSYLDTTPMGTILSLVTKDTEVLDNLLPSNLLYVVQQALQLIGIFCIAIFTSPWFGLLLIPMFGIIWYLRHGFHITSIQIKRYEVSAIAPVHQLFHSILRGSSTIRSYGLQQHFITKYRTLADTYLNTRVISLLLERRFGAYLNFLACGYICVLSIMVVLFRHYIDPNVAMLAVTSSVKIIGALQVTLRFYTQTTTSMTSVQRIYNLNFIPQEPPFETDYLMIKSILTRSLPNEYKEKLNSYNNNKQKEIIKKEKQQEIKEKEKEEKTKDGCIINKKYRQEHGPKLGCWPWYGEIKFINATFRYREELPIVLNNVTFTIRPGESCGIVGPTGAGKSTTFLALFRMLTFVSGRVEIDGVDITELGIGDLRSRLAFIPQFPTLFSGTVRDNVDLCCRYTDDEIWHCLRLVEMAIPIQQMDNGLYSQVDENGTNFSASQRQLLCIARALLTQLDILNNDNKNKNLNIGGSILIGDEISASLSIDSDDIIQTTIRNTFKNSTKLIVAHRLQSIIDSSKILVLKRLNEDDIQANVSSVAEHDIPYLLLNNPKSAFYKMAIATGIDGFISLYQRAQQAFPEIQKEQYEKYNIVVPHPLQIIDIDTLRMNYNNNNGNGNGHDDDGNVVMINNPQALSSPMNIVDLKLEMTKSKLTNNIFQQAMYDAELQDNTVLQTSTQQHEQQYNDSNTLYTPGVGLLNTNINMQQQLQTQQQQQLQSQYIITTNNPYPENNNNDNGLRSPDPMQPKEHIIPSNRK